MKQSQKKWLGYAGVFFGFVALFILIGHFGLGLFSLASDATVQGACTMTGTGVVEEYASSQNGGRSTVRSGYSSFDAETRTISCGQTYCQYRLISGSLSYSSCNYWEQTATDNWAFRHSGTQQATPTAPPQQQCPANLLQECNSRFPTGFYGCMYYGAPWNEFDCAACNQFPNAEGCGQAVPTQPPTGCPQAKQTACANVYPAGSQECRWLDYWGEYRCVEKQGTPTTPPIQPSPTATERAGATPTPTEIPPACETNADCSRVELCVSGQCERVSVDRTPAELCLLDEKAYDEGSGKCVKCGLLTVLNEDEATCDYDVLLIGAIVLGLIAVVVVLYLRREGRL